MKTRIKRLISILCIVTMFAGTILSNQFLSAKAETNSGQGTALPTDMTEISFRDFESKKKGTSGVFADGPYTGWNYGEYVEGALHNTLFGGTITFPKKEEATFLYAATGGQAGLNLTVAGNDTTGWYLRLFCSDSSLSFTPREIRPANVGLTELVGTELELHISTKYVDHDNQGTNNDLELGLWFGDKLYTDGYIYIDNYVDSTESGNYLELKPGKGYTITIKSTDMTELTFEDFEIEDGTYDNTFSGNYAGKTMDKTLFSAKIKFSETGKTDFMFGGTKASGSFSLQPNWDETNNKYYLRLYDTNADESGIKIEERLDTDKAGVTKFVGEEFKLNYTLEYVNHDKGTTKNDLKLGVWFNGKLYNNQYFYIDNYVDNGHSIGGYITVWVRDGATIDLKSCNYQLPDDLTDISFRDFGIVDRENYQGWEGKQYTGETLANTLFSGTVTFPEVAGAYFNYAGANIQEGLTLWVEQDDNQKWYLRLFHKNPALLGELNQTKIYAADAGVDELVGKALELHISMEYVNLDGGTENDDLKLGLWFGDTLYKDEYIYINNYVDKPNTGTYLTYSSVKSKGGAITLKSADIKLPKGMTELSFCDFGLVDGAKSGEYDGDTLHGTLFSGKITFPTPTKGTDAKGNPVPKGTVHLGYGGKVKGGGIELATGYDFNKDVPYLRLRDSQGGKDKYTFNDIKFYAEDAGVPFFDTELDLKITMEYIDNDDGGRPNDVKIGVWFDGKLYNNKYNYIPNYVDNETSMGTWMTLTQLNGAQATIESVGERDWKTLPEGLTELSFCDFGFTESVPKGSGEYDGDTLDDTLFSGKITLPKPYYEPDAEKGKDVLKGTVHFGYGGKVEFVNGKPEATGGIELATHYDQEAKEYYLRLRQPKDDINDFNEIKLYSGTAGVNLFEEEFDLNITLEYIDRDGGGTDNDVKLGVWFNGKLYNNRYIYLYNYVDNNYSMGTWMKFTRFNGAIATIESVGERDWKTLPEGMTEISFRNFGFEDGENPNGSGEYDGDTLDGTLFSGKITLPKPYYEWDDEKGKEVLKGTVHLGYGGKEVTIDGKKVVTGGIELATHYDQEAKEYYLRLRQPKTDINNFSEIKLSADVAGVKLFEEEFDLNITLEYVDRDGGGTDNDVKLGLWFDGKLYNNRYIYLYNYVDNNYSMGTWMQFTRFNKASVTIKSAEAVHWKPLPTDFTQLTFSDYGIKPGVYEGGIKTGTCDIESMDRTLFSGIVTYSTEGETHFTFGGKGSLSGLDLVNVYDEKTGEHYIRLFDTNANNELPKRKFDMNFYSKVAGVTLVGEELDLKISLEFIDHDADGAKDDLKLGIWFGGRLYNNRYIYVTDYVNLKHCIGNKLTIWNRNGSSFNVGRISEWLDWSAFGLTANWKKTLLDTDFNLKYALAGGNPYTGDSTKHPYLAVVSCLVAIVLCGRTIVKRRREENGIQR